jgi:hypothetical protein
MISTAMNITLLQLNVSLVGFGATGHAIHMRVKKLYRKPTALIGRPNFPRLNTAGGRSAGLWMR